MIVPVLYYDGKTIDEETLFQIHNVLKNIYGQATLLPKEVNLKFVDKEKLIEQLNNTIEALKKSDKDKEENINE